MNDDGVRVMLLPDRVNDEEGWWYACAEIDGEVEYDVSARSPEEAWARLAEALAVALALRVSGEDT